MDSMNTPQRRKDLVYDVGMHKGEDTEYYLKKGFKVIGFEADPELAALCRKTFADAIARGQLTVVEGAIVESGPDRKGTVLFYKNLDDSVWGTIVPAWADRNEQMGTRSKVIEVMAINFIDCMKEHGVPYYMKIDIEGADRVCLEALLQFDARPYYLSMESEKVSIDSLRDDLDLLQRLGYTSFKVVQQELVVSQSEPKPSREGTFAGHRFCRGSSGLFGRDLSGRWISRSEVLDRYERIILSYRWFGDNGVLSRYFIGRVLRRAFRMLLRHPFPGWHDTHARHGSAEL